MTTLNDYLQDSQRLLREQRQMEINPADLIPFINRARREIAMRTQCVRVLTPISGPVVSGSVSASGSGYSSTPTISISAPDFPSGIAPNPGGAQATASLLVENTTIAGIDITYGGDGYFQPQATITDANGTGGTVAFTVQTFNQLNANQEVYPFSGIDLSRNPGCESVYAVKSISIIYANYRYSLPVYSFSTYQAMIRQYPFQYTYVPTFASQFGQGVNGSFYVYPLPSQVYQYELDCFCIPSKLTTNLSVEAIPDPWTDAVVFYACHLGMMSIQNYNVAKFYLDLYEKMANAYSNYARPGRAVNPYGRY